MLYLVHRVTISIKLRPIKLEQAVSESLPHKGLYTELLGVQLTCLDPVPASIRARNAQEINITNCDVTTWSWVNLVHPLRQACTPTRAPTTGQVETAEVRKPKYGNGSEKKSRLSVSSALLTHVKAL